MSGLLGKIGSFLGFQSGPVRQGYGQVAGEDIEMGHVVRAIEINVNLIAGNQNEININSNQLQVLRAELNNYVTRATTLRNALTSQINVLRDERDRIQANITALRANSYLTYTGLFFVIGVSIAHFSSPIECLPAVSKLSTPECLSKVFQPESIGETIGIAFSGASMFAGLVFSVLAANAYCSSTSAPVPAGNAGPPEM